LAQQGHKDYKVFREKKVRRAKQVLKDQEDQEASHLPTPPAQTIKKLPD
jgi:hypothetical protein